MNNFNNLYDYIIWRGDISLNQVQINDLDCLALSLLSYIEFDQIINNEEAKTLANAVNEIDFSEIKADIFAKKRFKLAEMMSKSNRFSNLVLHDYVNIINEEIETQFSAITINLGQGAEFVSFRGTDNTIVGWKEDFNMSFTSPVPSQTLSCEYLNNIYKKTKSKIIVAGHSKGGNLSVYSSTKCKPKVQNNIINVYSFDGPGFDEELIKSNEYSCIKPRIKSFMPDNSIVGVLLSYHDNYTVIESKSIGILQHDALSWNVLGKDFVVVENRNSASAKTDIALNKWLKEIDNEERKIIIDSIYSVFSNTKAKTVGELARNPKIIFSLLDALNDLSESNKKNLFSIIKLIISYGTISLGDIIMDQTGINKLIKLNEDNADIIEN